MPAQTYLVRLENDSRVFEQQGEKSTYGMVKSLGGASIQSLQQNSVAPYLGLALD